MARDLLQLLFEMYSPDDSEDLSWLVSRRKPVGSQRPLAGGSPTPHRYGALEPGNLDLTRRPYVPNADGSVSTVRSMSFREGSKNDSPYADKEILIPTVSDDGRIMSGDEAIAEYDRTGKHMGVYATVADANAAGEAIHEDQVKTPPVPWRDGLPENPYDDLHWLRRSY